MKLTSVKKIIWIFFSIVVSACTTSSGTVYEDPNNMTLQFSENKDALQARLQKIVDSQIGRDYVQEIALSLSTGNDDTSIHLSGGEEQDNTTNQKTISEDTTYFTASTSKLFATTLILQLVDEGKFSLDDTIVSFFAKDTLRGLHESKGLDSTANITIRHLMAHTSGIADYFEDKQPDGSQFSSSLMNNQDSQWSVSDVIDTVKSTMKPHFLPGASGKAHYSDTNFQLLGAIIENVTNKSLAENIDSRITTPLNLKNTYLFTQASVNERMPVLPMRFKDATLTIPMAMESVRLDGGMVSSSADSLIFLQAFMQGKLFDSVHLADMQQWKSIGFPLQSGVGILKFKLPKIFTPFSQPKVIIGHSGISGAFAFYSPTTNVYLAGTINQLDDRALPYKFMLKVINAAKTE